jgi:glyoxylase-like metal-dependent hydrolase (beta-lactamase superfamily II)
MHPVGKWAVEGSGSLFGQATLRCHLLLVETDHGLVLVETALGTKDVADPDTRLPGFWRLLTRPVLDPQETAAMRVERLGFRRSDVGDIVLTHLDLDHTGGLADFPAARVHLSAVELGVATKSRAGRYRKQHWAHDPRWVTHEFDTSWFDFPAATVMEAPEIRLVSLPGHSAGHSGVAVKTGATWLLHAGDAYFHRSEIRGEPDRKCPVGLEAFQTAAQTDAATRLGTQGRLRALFRSGKPVRLFSAHDPVELRELL